MLKGLLYDARSIAARDPAAKSVIEVILLYPGFHAILFHRFSHYFYKRQWFFIARLISQLSRFFTGIEIHPGAIIGKGLFIDHGMGVVIGETAEIGDNCTIYHGVTLGGTGKDKGKRHPTIGNNVLISTGAKILGPFTVGDNSKIGANSVVLHPVEPNTTVVGVPGRAVKRRDSVYVPSVELDQIHSPDPVAQELCKLLMRVEIWKGNFQDKISPEMKNIKKCLMRVTMKRRKKRPMKLYNTLTRKKEEFRPLDEKEVKIYSCGPTVYNYFHIGNARPFIIFDSLRRYLEFRGYSVKFVQNFTDIDDKMIRRANEEGITVKELADRFIEEYFIDAKGLGVKEATVHPKATENIDAIIELIQKLEEKGFAYAVDGDVYFDTKRFAEYGKLSHQSLDDLESGSRVDVDDRKRDPMDFALWKAQKPAEPAWDSPWGKGRPGWHIECSAMANRYLGETIDIHSGGQDLIFPHHENEIAQSEAASGKPFVRYWLHNGFINVNNEKMSKSAGNFFTVRDIVKEFDYEVLRFFMLSAHYRNPINFSADLLEQAKNGLERLYNSLDNLEYMQKTAQRNETPGPEEKAFIQRLEALKEKFIGAMDDDLNTADAISVLFEMVKEINSNVTAVSGTSAETIDYCIHLLKTLGGVLGILQKEKQALLPSDIEGLIEQRQQARKEKNWKLADEIRDHLKEMGIVLEDTPQGVKWKKV